LTDEFKSLIDDTVELTWAREAFGKPPDAINFWMGDARAVTSTHKDPYENIYCVVRGFKDFVVFPPTDLPWLRYRKCAQAKYVKTPSGDFKVEDLPDLPEIPWIVVDPLKPGLDNVDVLFFLLNIVNHWRLQYLTRN
jgi:jumonji domain-containing protein 7